MPNPLSFNVVLESALSKISNVVWRFTQLMNKRISYNVIHPKWSKEPTLKSHEKTSPPLGFPRQTDSLCPRCVIETREKILSGEADLEKMMKEHPGYIKQRMQDREGIITIEKECPKHGSFKDIMSLNVDFTKRIESLFSGRDFKIPSDRLHQHGKSSIQYGRGAVLTMDLTNRCNMMCDPCFMDANQVGYVHELNLDEIKKILWDSANAHTPKRQTSLQFSGGEPTISPHFIEAIRYAKELGFFSVQAATNGIRFAQDREFCREAAKAGLRFAYLQFDGTTPEQASGRGVGNLLEVKRQAIKNLAEFGITVALVVTVVNTINNDQLGGIMEFAMENIQNIHTVAFQPVSFTGRDEDLSEEQRLKWRYTLSHLVRDLKQHTGYLETMRDWFPLSASSPFSDLSDLMKGPGQDWGTLKCGCHPNCGIASFVMVNMTTKEQTPVSKFINVDQFMKDVIDINDYARRPQITKVLVALALLRNWSAKEAPTGMRFVDLLKQLDSHSGGNLGISHSKRFRWGMLTLAGMWFQDLWNYDFRRTEMCTIPYATQMGEISFCAYNTGVGYRKILENIHQNAALGEWYKKNGRHAVYAKGKKVPLEEQISAVPSEMAPV
ncbi:MAG: radical SAM protein [Planctomycetota bacterium]